MQTDERSGAWLPGGDMIEWSDFAGGRISGSSYAGPVPATPVLYRMLVQQLVAEAAPESVLLLGPTAAALASELPDVDVDVLVRARADAGALRGAHDRLTLWCGSVGRFEPGRTWDLVVCLDAPSTLATPDDAALTDEETLLAFAGFASPTGAAIALLPNRMGADSLVCLADEPTDRDWEPTLHRLTARDLERLDVTGRRLTMHGVYAELPLPRLVADVSVLADAGAEGWLADLAARSLAERAGRTGGVQDAWAVVGGLAEAGQLGAFAPAWLVGLWGSEPHLPDLLVDPDELPGDALPQWRRPGLVNRVPGRLVTAADEFASGRLVRRAAVGEPAAGRVAEWLWREACATGRVEPIRAAVAAWADWIRTEVPAERRLFAAADKVAVEGECLTELDPSWELTEGTDADVAIVAGLRRFAHRLLRSGLAHPWGPDASVNGVTATLAAMAGVRWSDVLAVAAVTETEYVRAALAGRPDADLGDAVERAIAAGRGPALASGAVRLGQREVTQAMQDLVRTTAERGEQVEWLEAVIKKQDHRIKHLDRQLGTIKKSPVYKVARGVTWPARAAVRGGRSAFVRAVPPSVLERLEEVARGMLKR